MCGKRVEIRRPAVVLPKYPDRVKLFTYACAAFAQEEEMQKLKVQAGGAMRRALG